LQMSLPSVIVVFGFMSRGARSHSGLLVAIFVFVSDILIRVGS
jgi:hypothetical protein